MPRRRKEEDLERLYQAVEQYPGQRASFFARLLNWPRSKVTRALPDLEDRGYLLYEDDRGGLYPFKKHKDK